MITPTRRTLIGMGTIPALSLVPLPWTPRLTFSRDGTPAAGSPVIPDLLSLVPARIFKGDDPAATMVTLSDIAAELAYTETPLPETLSDDDPDRVGLSNVLVAVAGRGSLFQYAYVDDWRALHGFDIRDVDQVVEFGVPPGVVTLLRGRFDRDAINDALSDQGYETIEIDGHAVWNRGADYELDLEHPIARYWLGQAQNIALIDDETLVFAGAQDLISTVLATASGEMDALIDEPTIVGLFPADQDPLIAATIIRGDITSISDQTGKRGQGPAPNDVGPLVPPIAALLFGATPGNGVALDPDVDYEVSPVDYPLGENQIRVAFVDPADAGPGSSAIEERLAEGTSVVVGQDWADILGETQLSVDDQSGIAVISIPEWLPGQRDITRLLYQRDLGFLSTE